MDGPHNNLNMGRKWKEVAKRADFTAFTVEDGCDALEAALEEDFHNEFPQDLAHEVKSIFCEPKIPFRGNSLEERLESVQEMNQGGPLFFSLMEYAVLAAAGGAVGEAALLEAGEMAILDRAESRKLQIHGHFKEEENFFRAGDVASRIENCIELWDVKPFIRRLFGVDPGERRLLTKKRSGLNEGVLLS